MVCRCASPEIHAQRARDSMARSKQYEIDRLKQELDSLRADIKSFRIEDIEEVGQCLVVKVLYQHPNGAKRKNCSFEGVKIMVFRARTMKDAIKWREIDPHFRERQDERKRVNLLAPPPPLARFPGDAQGWAHALAFAKLINS